MCKLAGLFCTPPTRQTLAAAPSGPGHQAGVATERAPTLSFFRIFYIYFVMIFEK
jgi:hypothetical protein